MKYFLIIFLGILIIPVLAINDWRDAFPMLYIYDELLTPTISTPVEIIPDNSIEKKLDDNLLHDIVTYYVYDIPDYALSYMSKDLVYEALKEWQDLNPQLTFKEVTDRDDAQIKIVFVKSITFEHPVLGISKQISVYENHSYNLITVDITGSDCNGKELFWSFDTIRDTIKHEVGHALGLGHTADKSNLMYDAFDGTLYFNNHGYTIPKSTTYGGIVYLVYEKAEVEKHDKLKKELIDALAKYGWTLDDWESQTKGESSVFYAKIKPFVERLNVQIEKVNCFIESKN